MSINIPMSRVTTAYPIKNPDQTTNAFTITDASAAAKALNLKEPEKIAALKNEIRHYDMTSINSDELKKVGRMLFDNEMIDVYELMMFTGGNLATGADGLPTDTHVKFNAIALFNERLQDYDVFLKSNPADINQDTLGWRKGMAAANHAVGALTYFINSSRNDLSIHEQA